MRHSFIVLLALLLFGVPPAHAQDFQDVQVWSQTVVTGQLSEKWRSHLELQPRVFDNGRELGITIFRGAVGRQVTPRVSLWGGYAAVARSLGPATTWEKRAWQQMLVNLPRAGTWVPLVRLRLEQRWIPQRADTSHRVRVMARGQRPFKASSPWHVALYDEAMFTLDTTASGPYRGFDRNRAFGGVSRRLSPAVTIEGGYLWENSSVRGPGQRNEHVGLVTLNVAWPRR